MIKSDRHIGDSIRKLWESWKKLEYESRRPSRAETDNFKKKKEGFEKSLSIPFNICKSNAHEIIRNSGIKDWEEESEYLKNQLSEDQIGCPGPIDKRQFQRDQRIIERKTQTEHKNEKEAAIVQDLQDRKEDIIGDDQQQQVRQVLCLFLTNLSIDQVFNICLNWNIFRKLSREQLIMTSMQILRGFLRERNLT